MANELDFTGKQVLVADAGSVTAYDLFTGRQRFRHELSANGKRGTTPAVPLPAKYVSGPPLTDSAPT